MTKVLVSFDEAGSYVVIELILIWKDGPWMDTAVLTDHIFTVYETVDQLTGLFVAEPFITNIGSKKALLCWSVMSMQLKYNVISEAHGWLHS